MQKAGYHSLIRLLEVDTDGSGDLSPDELRGLANDLEGDPLEGEELRDALISAISDMHKDIYYKRPNVHDLRQMSTEELEQEHDKTSEAHKDWWYEERHREDQDMWRSDEEAEDEPKQIGMGRRPLVGPARDVRRGKKISEQTMKITRRQLRQIIQEEVQKLDEIPTWRKMDAARRGVPHPGSHPGPRPGYGEGNLTIEDVEELFPNLSKDEQDDIWEEWSHLNNAGELKAAILGL